MVSDLEYAYLLRPSDEVLSSRTKFQVQIYRLLSVFGVVMVPLFGFIRMFTNPEAVDPMWIRLGVAGVLAGGVVASYVSERARRNYPAWMRGVLCGMLTWFVGVAAANGFTGNYDTGLLLFYSMLLVVVGIGARSMRPVLLFAAFGFLLSTGAIAWGASPRTGPPVLILGVGTTAVVGSTVTQGWLSIQKRLHAQEKRLHALNENVSDGLYRSAPDEGLVYANQAFADLFGYESVEEVLDADPASLYADPAVRDRLQARAHKQGKLESTEVEFRRKDGSTFSGLLSVTVVRDEEGQIECYDGAVTDISETKRREAQLRRRNRQMQTICENVTEVVWMSPADKSEIEFVSEAYEEIWGRPTEELKQHPDSVVESIHPGDRKRVRKALTVQKETPEAYEETYRVVQPDGTIRWVRDRAAGVYDENGQLERIVGVASDITELHRLQERLLEVQAEERRRIGQEIHDEMGGLLASLQFTVDLARTEAQQKGVSESHFNELANLVNKLSTLARTISRKLYPSDLSGFGLAEALSSLIDEMKEQRGLEIEFHSNLETKEQLPELVERTAYWIVHEALVNVARHAEVGHARLAVNRSEHQLFLQISDEGVGFTPSTEGGEKSFGLEGIQRRIDRLDGEMELDTKPGRGTKLSVLLPAHRVSESRDSPDQLSGE